MKKILVVVDMQNDFIDGALGSAEAQAIVDNAVKKIESFDGAIYVTYDTHYEDYMETSEGKKLPVPHCIVETEGWMLNEKIQAALDKKEEYTEIEKPSFGSCDLPFVIMEENPQDELQIEIIGLCTDICVVSNALMLKAYFPEAEISVDSSCCAGVTPGKHEAALETMRSCQIDVK